MKLCGGEIRLERFKSIFQHDNPRIRALRFGLTLRLELPADLLEAVDERGCIPAGDMDRVGRPEGGPLSGPGDRRCNDR